MKKTGNLIIAVLWLFTSVIFAFEGKSWAAILSFIGSVIFLIFFLYYRKKNS